jgi:hypothetical protein
MLEQRFYRAPLLRVLAAAGGSLSRQDALAAMGRELALVLKPEDRVPMADRPTEEGWRNRTSWEVKDLKEEGLLLPTSVAGKGRWALSPLGSSRAAAAAIHTDPAGVPYVVPPRPSLASAPAPFDVDPDAVDRGLGAHHDVIQLLVAWVSSRGGVPLAPPPSGPFYDLAWWDGTLLVVAEVKSLTATNEERQLRLGLGQLLRYRQALTAVSPGGVVGWLVVENEPSDLGWSTLCDELGLKLMWPTLLV